MNLASFSWLGCPHLLATLEPPATPPPPHNSWRMIQGNAAPGSCKQTVTWNMARSDFLITPSTRTHARGHLNLAIKSRGGTKWNPGWWCEAQALAQKNVPCPQFNLHHLMPCKNANLSFLPTLGHAVVIPGSLIDRCCWTTRASCDREGVCLHFVWHRSNILFVATKLLSSFTHSREFCPDENPHHCFLLLQNNNNMGFN